MKIGIDIDNVISNFDEILLNEFIIHDKELGNNGVPNKNADYITIGMFNWAKEEIHNFYHDHIERIAKSLSLKDGAKQYIDKLKQDGHMIYIVTGRDNGEYSDPYTMTKEWLSKFNIYYDDLILTNSYQNDKHGKTKVCLENGIDIMIDDSAHICNDCIENGIEALLMDTPYNQKEHIQRVHNWNEIYDYISNHENHSKANRLSFVSKILILDQSIGKIISIFLDIFLAAYFYKISSQNILYLSIYNIVTWIIATIGALLVANIIKTKDKIKLYRFGIFIKSLYIFMIILLGEKIVSYVYVLGIMNGISIATTGFPFNMIESENISKKERCKYVGYALAATEIMSFVVPILLGAYITVQSYQVVAILIFVFSILKFMFSFYIKNKNVQKSKVNLKDFHKLYKNDTNLKKLYIIEFLKGFNRYGVMSLVVSLLIIYQTSNDFELGGWTSVFSIFTIIAMFLFGKYYHKDKKNQTLMISLLFSIISFIFVLYKVNMTTVILYNIVYYIFMNIILKTTEIDLFDYSNKLPFKTMYNTEYFIYREIFLNIGRILGYVALLILVGFTQNLANLNIIFFIIVLSIVGVVLISQKIKIK